MEYNKQITTYSSEPAVRKTGKTFVLLTLFGAASFYGISAVGLIIHDIWTKVLG